MLSASALAAAGAAPAAMGENLALIRSAALQMDGLIQDLLDVTRVDAGQLIVDMKPMLVSDLLEHCLSTLRPLLVNAGLALQVEAGPPLRVMADAARIGQVFSNLIGNAMKFTGVGGRITITAARTNEGARISVSDTGSGIGREVLPHVFDRFWQMPDARIRARGAGLGLPIARGIVHAHGGRIWAESEAGKGSTFSFTITLAP